MSIIQHPAFRETINSILTATNQEQSTNIVLIASAKIRKRTGSISSSSIYGQLLLLVTRDSLIFLGDGFLFLFMVCLNKIRTLGESKILSFCFWCWSKEWGKERVQELFVLPQGFWCFPSLVSRARWGNLVRFNWRLMLLWVMGVGFERTYIVSVKYLQKVKCLQELPLIVFLVCGYNSGFSIRGPSSNPMCSQFSIVALWNLCSESMGAWNFEIIVEDSDDGSPSSIAVNWRGWGGDRMDLYMFI